MAAPASAQPPELQQGLGGGFVGLSPGPGCVGPGLVTAEVGLQTGLRKEETRVPAGWGGAAGGAWAGGTTATPR